MTALLRYDLQLSTECDYTASFTWGTSSSDLTDFTGASAAMMIRRTPASPAPLVSLTTAPSSSGQIYIGIAPPGPFGATVANLTALTALDPSPPLTAGTIVAVTAPISYYAWSPGGTAPVDGVTVVAGIGGQWLLCATIRISITKAAMAALVGIGQASYDLLVTWADSTTTKFLEGLVLVDQSDTHD